MSLNPKNTKSMVASRSRTYAPGYGDLTLGGAELEEVKSMLILGATFESKLTFEIHLREVVSKAARGLGVEGRQESYLIVYVFPCKSCFNAYVLPNLEYCAPVRMSSGSLI